MFLILCEFFFFLAGVFLLTVHAMIEKSKCTEFYLIFSQFKIILFDQQKFIQKSFSKDMKLLTKKKKKEGLKNKIR